MRLAFKILLALGSVAVAWQAGRPSDRVAGGTHRVPAVGGASRALDHVSQLRGLAVQLHGGDKIFDTYHQLVPEIAKLGANTVLFVLHGWQTHAGSLDLHVDPRKTANDKQLGQLLDLAAVHGLRRVVMPVVLLTHPRNGEWRGKIIPPGHDWDAWFKRYRQFISRYAKLCQKHQVEILMVGSELIKSETYTDRWRQTIAEVRSLYSGKLGYSANWDHYQTDKIGFWPELDYIGMTSYYELAKKANPEIAEIDANWNRIRKNILEFQREVGKPILFTEVGWCSQEGAAHEGWNYYANQKATAAGHREQAILYESFMKAWSDEPSVGGIIWWEWDNAKGGKDDFGYTPRGKISETLLRLWFANREESTAALAGAVTSQPAR